MSKTGLVLSKSKQRSLTFLCLLCFSLADVRDGIGPFLGVYLQSQNWSADLIGYAMTISGIAAMLCTPLMGDLADKTHKKRALLALASILMILACGIVFLFSNKFVVFSSKFVQGAMSAFIAPALAAITLGLVGQAGYPVQLGKNEAWNHFGNATSAILGGLIGYYYGIIGVFYVLVCMAIFCLFCLYGIKAEHIDHAVARGLKNENSEQDTEIAPTPLKLILENKALLAIALVVAFFHFGNAAMLPLLGQSAVARFEVNPAAYTAATIVLAQAVMLIMALLGAWIANKKGYAPLFFIALIALPVRGLIAGFYDSAWNIIPVQILDGIGNGLMGVATPGIVARLLQGSGHINLGLGLVLTLKEIGASLSSSYGGIFAYYFSYNIAFVALAIAPCIGLAIYLVALAKFRDLAKVSHNL